VAHNSHSTVSLLAQRKKILIGLNVIPFAVRQKRLCCWAAIKLVNKMPHNVPCAISEVISEHLGAKQKCFSSTCD